MPALTSVSTAPVAGPRIVHFPSPLFFKDPKPSPVAAKPLTENLRGVGVGSEKEGGTLSGLMGIAFVKASGLMKTVLDAYDTARDGVELIHNGLYWRKLRHEFEATSRPDELKRYVFDAKGWCRLPPDAVLARKEGDAPTGDADVDAAYDNVGFVFEFMKNRLNVVLSGPLVQVVNYNDDETSPGLDNAEFKPFLFGANYMIFGKGDGKTHHSLARAIDVVGHEAMHKVLDEVFPEKFVYEGQAGAINEHICDVVGTCIKAEKMGISGAYPEGFWRLGAAYLIDPDQCIRDMMDPDSLGQIGHMKDFVMTDEDDGGVHDNSGILNRLFALFCVSVKGPCYGVPLEIWLNAIKMVNPNPSLRDFAKALMFSAMEHDEEHGTKLQKKMLTACRKTGLTDYAVAGDEVVRIKSPRVSSDGPDAA
jgi:Zn-dependent metalloprotease